MEIGSFCFNGGYSVDHAALARRAEDLGFHSFWAAEHAFIPVHTDTPHPAAPGGIIPDPYLRIPDPFVVLGRVAAVTSTIKLGTGVCLVPERNPLLLAKEVATLDCLSRGRFLFGIGAGWLREETEILGGDFPHRWTQTREAVEAMKELWTKGEAEHHGRYYDFPAVRSFPKPVQKPHPLIFLGGTARNVFRRVVEWADGWMPVRVSVEELKKGRATLDRLAQEAGRDPASIQVVAYGLGDEFRSKQAVRDLGAAGVAHATMWLNSTDQDGALKELEEVARLML